MDEEKIKSGDEEVVDSVPNPWHRLYPEAFEPCKKNPGMAGDWLAALRRTFDQGFEAARRVDHDCAMERNAEERGYQRAVDALRENEKRFAAWLADDRDGDKEGWRRTQRGRLGVHRLLESRSCSGYV